MFPPLFWSTPKTLVYEQILNAYKVEDKSKEAYSNLMKDEGSNEDKPSKEIIVKQYTDFFDKLVN